MLPIIFVVPIVQMLILVNAATLEMKNINLCVCDQDMSGTSRLMTGKFSGSPFFRITEATFSNSEAVASIESGKADIAMVIPHGFERNLMRGSRAEVQILVNAINGTVAAIGNAFAGQIIAGYGKQLALRWQKTPNSIAKTIQINTIPSYWYNPEMNYKVYMVPAILVILVTLIGMMLATMNIVREKEMGTIEQINVTPIRKIHFIAGKLIPFWIIALFMLSFGLSLGKLIFNIPMVGNLGLLFGISCIYLLLMQGIGLLISNSAATQQQALFVSYFFMIVFIMMSGIFTPAESMPRWAQLINYANPIAYYMKLIRMILLKGSGFIDVYKDIVILTLYSIGMISLAVWRYRKVS